MASFKLVGSEKQENVTLEKNWKQMLSSILLFTTFTSHVHKSPRTSYECIIHICSVYIASHMRPFNKVTGLTWHWHLLVQSQQWKHQNDVWILFDVNNKDTRTTSLTPSCYHYCWLWTDFVHYSSVFTIEFEQVNTGSARIFFIK